MDLGEVDVAHVVRAIIVADLSARPIYAFDLDDFIVLDGTDGGDLSALARERAE